MSDATEQPGEPEIEEVDQEGVLLGAAGFVQCVGCGEVLQFTQEFEPSPDTPAEVDVVCEKCSTKEGKIVVIPVVLLCGSQTTAIDEDDGGGDVPAP